MDREHRLQLFSRDASDAEDAGLRRFNQEDRLVAGARGDRQCEHALVHVLVDLLAARAEADFDLRRFAHLERLRGAGVLKRKVLDVDLVDLEGRILHGLRRRGLRIGHDYAFSSRGSSLPSRSRA